MILAMAGLLVCAPLLAAVAATVRWKMGAPVLFRQRRSGWHGQPFSLLKFRTMTMACDSSGAPLPDRVRLTPLGRWLRRTSLDELPGLWNVLRGDMSLVGPRPQMPEYYPYLTQRQRRRGDVRPGITGLAQVRGRNDSTFRRRFALDVLYVERLSPGLDFRILLETAAAILRDDGGLDSVERHEAEAQRAMARGSF